MPAKVGGQALIEGVMMLAPKSQSIAVRLPDGHIIVRNNRLSPLSERHRFFRLPIVRGVVSLFSMLILGIKALTYSANKAYGGEEQDEEMGNLALSLTVVAGIGFGLGLFFILPLVLTRLLRSELPILGESGILFNLVDGLFRVVIFLIYLRAITLLKDIKRVFEYHGAEHKSIFAYEAGDPLTLESARKYGTLHPRCGTSFLLMVMVVSILVFSLIHVDASFAVKAGSRILLVPLIAGISYEAIKFGDRKRENRFFRALLKPGLWLQRLTTKEPSDDQIEIALKALKEALAMEKAGELPDNYCREFVE